MLLTKYHIYGIDLTICGKSILKTFVGGVHHIYCTSVSPYEGSTYAIDEQYSVQY